VWTCQKKKKKKKRASKRKSWSATLSFSAVKLAGPYLLNLLESLKRNHVFGHGCHVRFVFALSFAFQGIEETRQDTNKTK
jgi:hypothetical protein